MRICLNSKAYVYLVPLGKAINIASDIWNLDCIIYHPQFGENN